MRILLMALKQYLTVNTGAQVNVAYIWCYGYVPEQNRHRQPKHKT